jgi:hypothetical protein
MTLCGGGSPPPASRPGADETVNNNSKSWPLWLVVYCCCMSTCFGDGLCAHVHASKRPILRLVCLRPLHQPFIGIITINQKKKNIQKAPKTRYYCHLPSKEQKKHGHELAAKRA